MQKYIFELKSKNRKTGEIPVVISPRSTCPNSCGLKRNGCYADFFPMNRLWNEISKDEPRFGITWEELLSKIEKIPMNQIWKFNAAGDLPGHGDQIDTKKLSELVTFQIGSKGFTYTHYPLRFASEREAIKEAIYWGFAINLSADTLWQADQKANLGIAPVVVVLPEGQLENLKTPEGRRVIVCPAYTKGTTCSECKMCARLKRKSIIGFPAHGQGRKKVNRVFMQTEKEGML